MKPPRIANGLLPSRLLTPGICVLLAAMVWAVFGQTLGHGFVGLDDNRYVYDNPHVTGGLTLKGIGWAFTHSHGDNWHPLTSISHMLDCQVYGLKPWGHHLTNVLLHGAAAILLFLVLGQMTGAPWRSAFAAAVFAIHPLRVESVAWVSERKDVLSGVFFMLTLWAYARYARKPASRARYFSLIALFAAGLMCKPTLVTLPFVLLLLDYWPLGRFREEPGGRRIFSIPRNLIVEKIPLFALAALSCVATMLAQENALISADKLPFADRIYNALVSYAVYLGEMIYPAGLAPLYPYPAIRLQVWEALPATVLLAAISAGVFVWRRKHPCLLTGWLWYLGMLLPMSGLIQVGWLAHADRYTYLPQIGLYIAIAWMAADLCPGMPWRRAISGALGSMVAAALMWCAWIQTTYWKNSETLWTRDIEMTSNNAEAYNNLGSVFREEGQVDKAFAYFLKAQEIDPDSAEAHYNLGVIYQQMGDPEQAIAQYQRSIEIEPRSAKARNNLGNAFRDMKRVNEAIDQYQMVLEIDPDFAEARNNLGYVFQLNGNVDGAIAQYQKALEIMPDMLETRLNLGIALGQKGEMNKALAQFQKAVEINPGSAKAHNDLGLALLQCGNVDESIGHFQKALEIEPGNGEARNNLGLALRERGK